MHLPALPPPAFSALSHSAAVAPAHPKPSAPALLSPALLHLSSRCPCAALRACPPARPPQVRCLRRRFIWHQSKVDGERPAFYGSRSQDTVRVNPRRPLHKARGGVLTQSCDAR